MKLSKKQTRKELETNLKRLLEIQTRELEILAIYGKIAQKLRRHRLKTLWLFKALENKRNGGYIKLRTRQFLESKAEMEKFKIV